MSAIDSIKHERIGTYNGLPVYKPFHNSEDRSVPCKVGDLVLGGGSGEHPALVITNIDRLVFQYLLNHVEDELPINLRVRYLAVPFVKCFQYHYWSMANFHQFVENMLLKDKFDHYQIENNMADFLGKLVLEKHQDLIVNQQLIEEYNNIQNISDLQQNYSM